MKKLFPLLTLLFSTTAFSMVLDWQGLYRFEGVQLDNAEFDGNHKDTSYMLHHLILKPKMIASDGIVVHSRFDLFNNANFANTQMGQFFGNGPGTGAPKNQTDSNVLSQTQKDEQISVTELYVMATSEYGQLTVGRKMFHFGLGISHNAGKGMFDHYFDSKDLIAYKMAVGNFTFTPMYGKVNEGALNLGDDINDYMVELSYNNSETETQFGILYEARVTGGWGNDAPVGSSPNGGFGGGAAQRVDHWNGQRLNLFFERKFTEVRVGFEASTLSGETGVVTPGEMVSLTGFGVAFELEYKPATRWAYELKAGLATGDDPSTNGKYEGFIFDRNYNVGFMLFNQVLGQYDVFRTSLGRRTITQNNDTNASAFADEEAISNVFYISPEFDYHWKPDLDLGLRFVWAQLNIQPVLNKSVDTNVGYEVDLNLKFKPSEKIVWINELGLVFPGGAFSRAGDFKTDYAYGLNTKAAISF